MIILGISAGFHDAAVTVIEDGDILFAAHSERYSKIKNDCFLNQEIINAALQFGKPDQIALHEKNLFKKLRHIRAGAFSALKEPSTREWIEQFYPQLANIPIKEYWHHETHAAAGVLTSDFGECAVMVIDAIGEFDTATIWHWKNNKLTKKHSVKYPNSLGLFYSAMTHRVGLKPMEDEYILMGMAAYSDKTIANDLSNQIAKEFFCYADPFKNPKHAIKMKKNLHKGIFSTLYENYSHFDIALAAQIQVEKRVLAYAQYAKQITSSDNLVFMGGVALNCVANSNLFKVFNDIHIMPNPGDAGSSLGAAALEYFNRTGNKTNWQTPYLGYDIKGEYPISKALDSLERGEIFGIANGRAEFGPRALGNRSLMADPRGDEIKDRVNAIKHRQKFRPFAPVILEEFVHEYFEMPNNTVSPYMQFVAKCKYPNLFPAIIHADGTSRVQTVNYEQHPYLHTLLSEFYRKTGCPMLLNTSLNIKGHPIVNDEHDAEMFTRQYGITVHTKEDERLINFII
jgi:carbamoyltransferase